MQVNRLFEIIYLLLNKKQMTAKELSEHFEVSQRTIYRDIEVLSQAGMPIYTSKGKGGGVGILSDHVLNKAVFTSEEKLEMLSALQSLNVLQVKNDNGLLTKLSRFFGQTHQNWIEVNFDDWGNRSGTKELWDAVKAAILQRRVIQFVYYSGKGESMERIVEPLKLVFKSQGWYLYGYCRTRQADRFFKLSRMRKPVASEESFDRMAPEQVFDRSQASPFAAEMLKVTLKFEQGAAFRIYDEFESYQPLEDGRFIVTFEMPKGDWLYGYLLSFGDAVEVIEPADVRKEVGNRLRRLSEKYDRG